MLEMLRRVFVLGRIATADIAARQAKAKVDPLVPHRDALFAAGGFRLDFVRLGEVFANVFHRISLAD